MVNNPYEILGVSQSASNDEIKKAYRDLSRKYHPDSYANNPLADLAEEKFKEVQEAYNQIMKERESGGGSSYSSAAGGAYGSRGYGGASYNSYGNQSGYGGNSTYTNANNQDTPEMQAVINFINSRRYQEALSCLSRMPDRNARWYYCSAVANAGVGNNVLAMDHARQAQTLEPANREYNQLVNQLQFGGQRYQQTGANYGRSGYGSGNFCCDLFMMDTCCECMGGDLCGCF